MSKVRIQTSQLRDAITPLLGAGIKFKVYPHNDFEEGYVQFKASEALRNLIEFYYAGDNLDYTCTIFSKGRGWI